MNFINSQTLTGHLRAVNSLVSLLITTRLCQEVTIHRLRFGADMDTGENSE